MKSKFILILILIIILLTSIFSINSYKVYKAEKKLKEITINYKAYEELYQESQSNNLTFSLTIEQLNYSKDSLVQKLNEVRKENKILNKEVKRLSSIKSETNIRDTVFIGDTVFKEGVKLDTNIHNKWYDITLGLHYPDTINIGIKIPSEKLILVSNKKETIDPPKKCWLGRLFQKKHIVTRVQVIESNPYIETTQSRFIEINK